MKQASCIYNWKELNSKYSLNANNDQEMLQRLIEKRGISKIKDILDELDGEYAFTYHQNDKTILARDILGIQPLWYSCSNGLAFASEKKELIKSFSDIKELDPRNIIIYDTKKATIKSIRREFFKTKPEIKESRQKIIQTIINLMQDSIRKRISNEKIGLLFSGGVDSATLALLMKKLGCKFTCYIAAVDSPTLKEPEDLIYSKKAAKGLGLPLKIIKIKENKIEDYIKKIIPLIEDSNVVKVGVALPFYAACEQAAKDGCKIIFSGLGSEEIFGGYERHKQASSINKECIAGLMMMHERDTYRDYTITKHHKLDLKVPFLDNKLVEYSLRIPGRHKIKDGQVKVILREAALKLGLDKEIALRKKRAAQYGSNFHKALKKLARQKGFKLISEYLKTVR